MSHARIPSQTTPYSLGNPLTHEAFLEKKRAAASAYLYKLQREHADTNEIKELTEYLALLDIDQQRINQHRAQLLALENRPIFTIINALFFTPVKNFFMKLGFEAGLFGATTNIFYNAIRATADYFFSVLATPLYLIVSAAYALEDIHAIRNDTLIQQRKTRYGTNIATLGLVGLGLAITFASFVAAPITLPFVMMSMMGVAYYKNHYVLKRTNEAIEEIKSKITKKDTQLTQAIDALIRSPSPELQTYLTEYRSASLGQTALQRVQANLFQQAIVETICRDQTIQRLAFQRNDYQIQLKRLEIQRDHATKNKKGLAGMIFGIGLIMLGFVFPPAALPLAIIGGLIFITSASNFKHKIPNSQMNELDNLIKNQANMHEQREFLNNTCQHSLLHEPSLFLRHPMNFASLHSSFGLEYKHATPTSPAQVMRSLAANNNTPATAFANHAIQNAAAAAIPLTTTSSSALIVEPSQIAVAAAAAASSNIVVPARLGGI